MTSQQGNNRVYLESVGVKGVSVETGDLRGGVRLGSGEERGGVCLGSGEVSREG